VILHIVLFKPQQSLTAAERQAIFDTVTSSLERCPTIRTWRIGKRVHHGLPGYEEAMGEDYQYALILEFDDVQGLADYLGHREHHQLGSLFWSASASALAYDYEF
jgi:hypothetical protein